MKFTITQQILIVLTILFILGMVLGVITVSVNKYDYHIELNELHGVIIYNTSESVYDTIPLEHLEEYIYVDNI